MLSVNTRRACRSRTCPPKSSTNGRTAAVLSMYRPCPMSTQLDEKAVLEQFQVVWEATADAVPDNYPSLEDVQSSAAWVELATAASEAAVVFGRRGPSPEIWSVCRERRVPPNAGMVGHFGTSATPGYRGCLSALHADNAAAASPIDKEGSRHCHRPSAVRQCASYLVRLSAHITKRNQCTVQVIACPKDALIHLSTSREFPSGPQAIDCNRRLLQHDDGGSFVTAGIPHGGGSLRGSTRCRHLDP